VTRIRSIEAGDREAIRELIAGTNAFKPFEVDVAMELVDVALTQNGQDDYHPYVLWRATARWPPTPASGRTR